MKSLPRFAVPCLVALALCFSVAPGAGATNVSGVISVNTTWSPAGSPYVVTDDVTVAAGVKLTVVPRTGRASPCPGFFPVP